MDLFTVIDTASRVLPMAGVIGGGLLMAADKARQRLESDAQRNKLTAETEAIRVHLGAAQSAEIATLNQRISECHEGHFQTRALMDERMKM